MSIFSLNKNIEQIALKVSSDNGTIRLSGLDESVDAYRENLSPEQRYMTYITVNVFAVDGDGENIMDIGLLQGVLFEPEIVFSESTDFVQLCDMISSDACEMAEAVIDTNGEIKPSFCQPDRSVLYIRKIFVEETCRGFGVGRYLLDNINELVRHSLNRNFYTCALMPYPQIKTKHGYIERATENVDEKLAGLISFYEKAGFSRMEGSDCMYRQFSDGLDDLFELLHGE